MERRTGGAEAAGTALHQAQGSTDLDLLGLIQATTDEEGPEAAVTGALFVW